MAFYVYFCFKYILIFVEAFFFLKKGKYKYKLNSEKGSQNEKRYCEVEKIYEDLKVAKSSKM